MRLRLPLDAPGVDRHDAATWPEVDVCDAKDHEPRLATHRAHLVQGPTDYCAECAELVRRIYDVLGTHLQVEELPLGATVRRLLESKEGP